MEVAALFAVTLLLGALVLLVALAVGKRKEEIREEIEQAAESAGKRHVSSRHVAAVRRRLSLCVCDV